MSANPLAFEGENTGERTRVIRQSEKVSLYGTSPRVFTKIVIIVDGLDKDRLKLVSAPGQRLGFGCSGCDTSCRVVVPDDRKDECVGRRPLTLQGGCKIFQRVTCMAWIVS